MIIISNNETHFPKHDLIRRNEMWDQVYDIMDNYNNLKHNINIIIVQEVTEEDKANTSRKTATPIRAP